MARSDPRPEGFERRMGGRAGQIGNDAKPSVDAPFQARENVGIVGARGRMLSSVRPERSGRTLRRKAPTIVPAACRTD